MPGELTKIFVKGKKHPSFSLGPCQYVLVRTSGCRGANPNYVVSGRPKCGDGITGKILISKKSHLTQRSDRSERCVRCDFLLMRIFPVMPSPHLGRPDTT